jgi:hypothetical protein
MKITPGFNPEKKLVQMTVKTNLLKLYYPNLVGMINSGKEDLPNGTTVELTSDATANIMFPVPKSAHVVDNDEEKGVAIDPEEIQKITRLVAKFTQSAMRHRLKRTEFIPLYGYPLEELQKDVVAALKAKRNLCIIDTYENYLQMREKEYSFPQHYIEFGTSDYSKTVLLLTKGDMDGLRQEWESKLKSLAWY